jgi:hypothetical protein
VQARCTGLELDERALLAGRATREGGCMTPAKKSFRLELTKEQQAVILQKTGLEAKEVELRDDALRTGAEPKRAGNQP